MQTPDITSMNIENIAKLFPNVITEKEENGKIIKAIDFDILKQQLSKELVEDNEERYTLNWPWKKASLLKANTPINKTLRPCREDSVDFDTTENLYLEWDNFEVLKILQESYLWKVKMIYIDPPYNTGKDFVYRDNFKVSKENYEEDLWIEDEEGWKLFKNTDTNGRFHSDWLSMMYERLTVARDLLKDDWVIFMSIDDNEVHNLRKIADEIFWEENFISQVIWMKWKEWWNDNNWMWEHHEYILMYWKSEKSKISIKLDSKDTSRHITKLLENNLVDWIINTYKEWELFQLVNLSKQKDYNLKIKLINWDILEWEWYCPQNTLDEYISKWKVFVWKKWVPYIKSFLSDEKTWTKPSTLFEQKIWTTKAWWIEIKKLFWLKVFSYPKPSSLIERLLEILVDDNDIVLDFFSWSWTTWSAIFNHNLKNKVNIKCILVQIAEQINEKNAKNEKEKKLIRETIQLLNWINKKSLLTEIWKERIRRAWKKIIEENKEELEKRETPLDTWFRVYKTDSSNMKDVFYHPSELEQTNLLDVVSNIKEDRSSEDLLTQVILDLGLTLDMPIEKKTILWNTVYFVAWNSLVACFDENIDFWIVDEIAKEEPLRVVFRDNCFKTDSDRINFENKFKKLSWESDIRII